MLVRVAERWPPRLAYLVSMSPHTLDADGAVRLRAWREEDFNAAVAGHDAQIARWFERDHPPTVDELKLLVGEWQAARSAGRALAANVVEAGGVAVGNVEATPLSDTTASLAWTLWAPYRGRGYATEAVRLLIDVTFEPVNTGGLELDEVRAFIHRDNHRSIALARRCHLVLVQEPDQSRPQAARVSELTFTLSRNVWRRQSAR